jgi:predicted kinase
MMRLIRLWSCLFVLLGVLTLESLLAIDVDFAAGSQEIAVYEKVFKQQYHAFKNLHKKNLPGIIGFSGTPGMGKTRLAKHLETRLEGIRISSDEIRQLLRHHHLNPDKRDVVTGLREIDCYLHYCLARLELLSANKLYILDMSLDRTFQNVQGIASQNHTPLFVIRLLVTEENVEKRLKMRESLQGGSYLRNMKKWFKDYEAFGESFICDYCFDNNSEGAAENISDLVMAIEKKLFHQNEPH